MSVRDAAIPGIAFTFCLLLLPSLDFSARICLVLMTVARWLTYATTVPNHAYMTAAWCSVQLVWEAMTVSGHTLPPPLLMYMFKAGALFPILAFFEVVNQTHARRVLPEPVVLLLACIHAALQAVVCARDSPSFPLTVATLVGCTVLVPAAAYHRSSLALSGDPHVLPRVPLPAPLPQPPVPRAKEKAEAACDAKAAAAGGSQCVPAKAVLPTQESEATFHCSSLVAARALVQAQAPAHYVSPLGFPLQASLKLTSCDVSLSDLLPDAPAGFGQVLCGAGRSAGLPLDVLWVTIRAGCIQISGSVWVDSVTFSSVRSAHGTTAAIARALLPDLLQRLGLAPAADKRGPAPRATLQLGGCMVTATWRDSRWEVHFDDSDAGGASAAAPAGWPQLPGPRLGLARGLLEAAQRQAAAGLSMVHGMLKARAQVQVLCDGLTPCVMGSSAAVAAGYVAPTACPPGALQLWAYTPCGYVDVDVLDTTRRPRCTLLEVELAIADAAMLRHAGPAGDSSPAAWLQPLTLELWAGDCLLANCPLLLGAGQLAEVPTSSLCSSEPPSLGWWGGVSASLARAAYMDLDACARPVWEQATDARASSTAHDAWLRAMAGVVALQWDVLHTLLFVRARALAAGCCQPGCGPAGEAPPFPVQPTLRPQQAARVLASLHAHSSRMLSLRQMLGACVAPWTSPGDAVPAAAQSFPTRAVRALRALLAAALGYRCGVCEVSYRRWLWDAYSWARGAGSFMQMGLGALCSVQLACERKYVEVALCVLWAMSHLLRAVRACADGGCGAACSTCSRRQAQVLAALPMLFKLSTWVGVLLSRLALPSSLMRAMTAGAWPLGAFLGEMVEQGPMRAACGAVWGLTCGALLALCFSVQLRRLGASWLDPAMCWVSLVLVPMALDAGMRRRHALQVLFAARTRAGVSFASARSKAA